MRPFLDSGISHGMQIGNDGSDFRDGLVGIRTENGQRGGVQKETLGIGEFNRRTCRMGRKNHDGDILPHGEGVAAEYRKYDSQDQEKQHRSQ